MTAPVPVAVVGVGVMGANHARVYHESPRAQLVAVVDAEPKQAAAAAAKFGCAHYATVAELLQRSAVKAVSVVTPTALHAEVAAELMRAGIDVLVEKPLAPNRVDALALCQLARERECVLMVGHIERFNPAVRALRALILDGTFGEVTSIITRRVGLAPKRIKDADVVTDLAVHDIDIANFLLGRTPADVYAHGGRGVLADRTDYAELFLNYGTANVIISVNWLTPIKIRKLSITGTRGYGELDFVRQELLLYQPPTADTFDGFSDFMQKYGQDRVQRVPVQVSEPLRVELEHFLDCVERRQAPEVGCAEALAVLDVLERGERASRRVA
jgi:UDP-N-acetylglucosamine 3-dehydrogenase